MSVPRRATDAPSSPTVLVVDDDHDWRALAERRVRLVRGVRVLGSVAGLTRAMDTVLLAEPDVLLVGLGHPHPMERTDLTLLRMLAPSTTLVVASPDGAQDAGLRVPDEDATFVDKLAIGDVVETVADAAGVLVRGREAHPAVTERD